jgi:hypothetical protein
MKERSFQEVQPLWDKFHEDTDEEYNQWICELSDQMIEEEQDVGP